MTRNLYQTSKLALLATATLLVAMVSISQGAGDIAAGPREIASDMACGKCGMFPAKYPQWQTQVVFNDGKMTPFDGCKCMFGFLFNMGKYDTEHTSGDVAAVWVREFDSGDWINARKAHYVIGSEAMGPMGKELIPFANAGSAETFQKEYGGHIALYETISMETLKPLMGKMRMKGKMEKKGHVDM